MYNLTYVHNLMNAFHDIIICQLQYRFKKEKLIECNTLDFNTFEIGVFNLWKI